MSKITLEKFIDKTKETQVDVPWVTKPSNLKGQCVSLIQSYIYECLEQPAKARGNAKDWVNTYVKEGLGKVVTTPRKGDILVFTKDGIYGHIAIYIDKDKLYDQNNYRHDNGKAGYGKIFSSVYTILRPNAELLVENKEEFTKGTYEALTDMNVRKGAGTNYDIKKVKELTKDGQKNATSTNLNSNAVYKKGTKFTAQEIITNKNNSVWAKTPSGYVCLQGSTGNIFAKKI